MLTPQNHWQESGSDLAAGRARPGAQVTVTSESRLYQRHLRLLQLYHPSHDHCHSSFTGLSRTAFTGPSRMAGLHRPQEGPGNWIAVSQCK